MRGAVAFVAGAFLALAAPATAQNPIVQVEGPPGNPIRVAAGEFTIRALNFGEDDFPMELRLQVALSPDFDGALFADTIVAGPEATVAIPRLLPVGATLYWRAIALTARAGSFPSATTGPRTVLGHLFLLSPNNPAGQSLPTRRPTFLWSGSAVPASLPGWDFELRVEAAPFNTPVIIARTGDSTFRAPEDLEANTSYRWRVIARFPASGEVVEATSQASFVIRSDDAPLATLLYQNFPNPFPSSTTSRTCLWFDLAQAGPVQLDILDLRGQPVKRLIPSAAIPGTMLPGRYGRPPAGGMGGCDDDFTWDGTAGDGRFVPPGIYLVRFRAGGKQELRRIVFRGR